MPLRLDNLLILQTYTRIQNTHRKRKRDREIDKDDQTDDNVYRMLVANNVAFQTKVLPNHSTFT